MKSINEIDWPEIKTPLNEKGFALVPEVVSRKECLELVSVYPKEEPYRKVINMQRYRFGQGEYKYFSYPLPVQVQQLREAFYQPLAEVANQWARVLNSDASYPKNHS